METDDLSEEQVLLEALGQKISERPWPDVGELVTIQEDWDGPALLGAENFLRLAAGQQVVVKHRNADGLLYGTTQGKEPLSGWFGCLGCTATVQVTVAVPLGDAGVPAFLPEGPPSELSEEAEGPETPESELGELDGGGLAEVEEYLLRHSINESAAGVLRSLDVDLQKEVIRSDLSNCRNPSAVLLSRIERLRNTAAAAKGGGSRRGAAPSSLMPPPSSVERPRSRSPAPLRAALASRPGPRVAVWNQAGSDVEEFILRLGLDDRVADELRFLPLEEQQQVITTDLTNARNPSAVVKSRIQTVLSWSAARSAVDEYIARHGVDATAGQALRALPEELQQQVMRSDLSNSRNPSAVLLSRIRVVETQAAQAGLGLTSLPAVAVPTRGAAGAPPPPSAPPPASLVSQTPMGTAVEEYIQAHGLDDRVAQELWSLTPDEQQQIISAAITNARNPSAVVIKRIQNIRAQAQVQAAPRANARPPLSAPLKAKPLSPSVVEAYLERHSVDEPAARALLDLPPELQAKIVVQDLSNCRNPSAVLLSRCRSAAASAR